MGFEISSGDSDEPISNINITPFVDVALVLLVIFMVTAPALMKETFGIQLPKANATGEGRPQEALAIAITSTGQALLNGQPITDTALTQEVKKALEKSVDTQAVISADSQTKHGDVVKVIDLIKSSGLTRFAIEIQKDSSATPQ